MPCAFTCLCLCYLACLPLHFPLPARPSACTAHFCFFCPHLLLPCALCPLLLPVHACHAPCTCLPPCPALVLSLLFALWHCLPTTPPPCLPGKFYVRQEGPGWRWTGLRGWRRDLASSLLWVAGSSPCVPSALPKPAAPASVWPCAALPVHCCLYTACAPSCYYAACPHLCLPPATSSQHPYHYFFLF